MSDSVLKDPVKLAQLNQQNGQERFADVDESIQLVNSYFACKMAEAICAVRECISIAGEINSEYTAGLMKVEDFLRWAGDFEEARYNAYVDTSGDMPF